MSRRMRVVACVVGVVAVILSVTAVEATVISVGNSSFESPNVSASPYAAGFPVLTPGTLSYDAWGTESANDGVVLNGHYDRAFTNLTGAQCGWMDVGSWQSYVAYQDLTSATYEVGKAYTLKVGIGRLPTEQNMDAQMDIALFARLDATSNAVAGTTTVRYGDLSATQLTDYTVSVPTVQSTDAWAGKPISIWLHSQTFNGSINGSCWNFDNVRLSSITPEPSTLVLLVTGLLGLLAYAWRKRR
jgi:hypothetical protein